jgi:hypothetical protein
MRPLALIMMLCVQIPIVAFAIYLYYRILRKK